MKYNKILITFALCVGIQANIGFCSKKQQSLQEITETTTTQKEPTNKSYWELYAPKFMQKAAYKVNNWKLSTKIAVATLIIGGFAVLYNREQILQWVNGIINAEMPKTININTEEIAEKLNEQGFESIQSSLPSAKSDNPSEIIQSSSEQIQQSPHNVELSSINNLPTYDPNELNKQLHNPELYQLFQAIDANVPMEKTAILKFFEPNDLKNLKDYEEKLVQQLNESPVLNKRWQEEYEKLRKTTYFVGSEKQQIITEQLEPFKKETAKADDLMRTIKAIGYIISLIPNSTQEQ